MSRICAICDNSNEGTWICDKCQDDPVNRDWRIHPSELVDVEDYDSLDQEPLPADGEAGKFETTLAIEIMRLYCLDAGSSEVIAELSGSTSRYVNMVVEYWTENHGYTVSVLRNFFVDRVPGKLIS